MCLPDEKTLARMGELYGAAAARFPTYEAMVQSQFNAAMRSEFGEDEALNDVSRTAFAYARLHMGYMSREEELKAQDEAWEEGICSHGLDVMTCPCGCFEGEE